MAMLSTAGAGIMAGANLLGSAMNGSSGYGTSTGSSSAWEMGGNNSASSAWNTGDAYGYGITDSYSEGGSSSWGNSFTDGSSASALDAMFAREANKTQMDMWNTQAAYNAREAEKDRNFQEYMSNTAYQRAVMDLKRAGLNPILAVQNMGASTPTGSTASAGLSSASKGNATANSWSNSGSSAYNYSKSHSKNENWETVRGKSSSYSQGWNAGRSSSIMNAYNEYNNNIRELTQNAVGAVAKAIDKGGSALSNAVTNITNNYKNNKKYTDVRDDMGNYIYSKPR